MAGKKVETVTLVPCVKCIYLEMTMVSAMRGMGMCHFFPRTRLVEKGDWCGKGIDKDSVTVVDLRGK